MPECHCFLTTVNLKLKEKAKKKKKKEMQSSTMFNTKTVVMSNDTARGYGIQDMGNRRE